MAKKIKCAECGEKFDPDQGGGPGEDPGDELCDNCYYDATFECCACGERDYESQQRKMLVVAETGVRFLSGKSVPRGIYQVLQCPYYGGPMIGEGYLFDESLKRFSPLPPDIDTNGYPCGHLCRACQKVAEEDAGKRLTEKVSAAIRRFRQQSWHKRVRQPRFRRWQIVVAPYWHGHRQQFVVVGHGKTGANSIGAYGVAINKRNQIGLHARWLGPEADLELAGTTRKGKP